MRKTAALLLCLLFCLSFSLSAGETVTYGSASFDSEAEYIDLGDQKVTNLNKFITFLKNFPNLAAVDMFATQVTAADVKKLEKAFPDVAFGWTLQLMRYKDRHIVRTDAVYFSTKHGKCPNHSDSDFVLIGYCRNLLALDLGHNNLTDVSFLRNMPRLRVLILAENQKLRDIEPIGELQDLEYLELFWTAVRDLTPLTKLPNLMDLNLSKTEVSDWRPLMEMKQLKRLWVANMKIIVSLKPYKTRKMTDEEMQELREALPDTEIMFTGNSDGNGWRYYDDKKGSKAEGNLVPHFEVISRMMEQDTYIPFEESAPLPGEEPAEESFASSVEIDPSELFGGN